MKKPFKSTKVGKVLTNPMVKTALGFIPFGVGSTIEKVLDSNQTPEGQINREDLAKSLVKLGIYAVIIYLVLSGKVTWEDAERVKEFINQ